MATEIHVFKIIGTSPLLMHNPAAMLIAPEDRAKSQKERIPTPAAEAEAGAYRDESSGALFVPTIGFKRGLLYSASGKKIGKMAAPKVMKAGVFEAYERCPLYHPETGEPITTYEIHIATVVVMRARILRARAKVWPWACDVALEINDDYVARHHVLQVLSDAGKMSGLLDNRPEKGGPYGRYQISLEAAQVTPLRRKKAA